VATGRTQTEGDDDMSSIQKRVRNGRETWRVAWRDPDGKQRSKTFSKLADAKAKRTELDHSMQHGTYIDPAGRPPRSARSPTIGSPGR
jgi:hypothetical protein